MDGEIWTSRLDSALARAARELADLAGQARRFVAGLDLTEQLVLLGLVMIGLFYLVLTHLQASEDGQKAGGRFAGVLFVLLAVAAGFGWRVSEGTA